MLTSLVLSGEGLIFQTNEQLRKDTTRDLQNLSRFLIGNELEIVYL